MELPMKSVTSELRGQSLRKLLSKKKGIRVIEAHSPLSAMLVEKASYTNGKVTVEFDAFWSSSLTDSTVRGKPDTELLDLKSRLNGVSDIFEVTTKPLILDGDTGGKAEHFALCFRNVAKAVCGPYDADGSRWSRPTRRVQRRCVRAGDRNRSLLRHIRHIPRPSRQLLSRSTSPG